MLLFKDCYLSLLLKWGFLSEPSGIPSPCNYPLFTAQAGAITPNQGSNTLSCYLLVLRNTEAPCQISYHQFISVAQSCPALFDPMNRSTPGLPVHHQLPEFTQTHVHPVGDGIQPSHPLLSPSPPAPSPSQHQGLFHWVNSSSEVAKVLDFQLQHQSFQWTPRTDLP